MLINYKNALRFLSILAIILVSSCSKNDGPDTPPGGEPPANGKKIILKISANTTFGDILTDGNGRALYFFAPDVKGTSECIEGCEAVWPVFYADDATLPAGLTAADVATITRADGKKQTTYKGWPLYYYAQDATSSEVKGDGIDDNWFVAKSNYAIMLGEAQLVGEDGKNYSADNKEGTGITRYLTDGAGRTLYAYAPDTFNKNNWTKDDLSNDAIWPIYGSSELVLPSVITENMVMEITSAGKKQLTFKGHPLYYYGPDTKRGETKGVSVPAPGVWPVLTLNSPALEN
ncbi:COG4315 family predicted lipoprotein [Pedobacter sp. SAFR-022]|uniref:COG4315 family predicted lipoprotein n=1 Tax=Pedobacter sp. SAFR-022 TaxID=3436861 RepID=UPI003F805C8A